MLDIAELNAIREKLLRSEKKRQLAAFLVSWSLGVAMAAGLTALELRTMFLGEEPGA